MDLIRFLQSNENSRKIFGERELKIIEKQLYGIQLTQSEKNRLSRDIRQKFNFIREAYKFSEDFDIKKGAIVKNIIDETIKTIKKDIMFNKIKKIILFGSAVENRLTFASDLDIAVEFVSITLKEATLFRKRIYGRADQKIDIQVYNHLPYKIRKEIDEKGKVLYEKNK